MLQDAANSAPGIGYSRKSFWYLWDTADAAPDRGYIRLSSRYWDSRNVSKYSNIQLTHAAQGIGYNRNSF
jgi:hypothetical protein